MGIELTTVTFTVASLSHEGLLSEVYQFYFNEQEYNEIFLSPLQVRITSLYLGLSCETAEVLCYTALSVMLCF